MGKVTNVSATLPIEGVRVCLNVGGCETTNSKGEYSFSGLEAGTYEMEFGAYQLNQEDHLNYLSQRYGDAANPEANRASVAMGGTTEIDDELEEGAQISGKMINATTKVGANTGVCVEDLSAPDPRLAKTCARTVSGGEYSISELPAGTYRVVFSDGLPAYYFLQYYHNKPTMTGAELVSLTPGSSLSEIDAELTENSQPEDGAIAGEVTDSSTRDAIQGIEVCAYDRGGEEPVEVCATTDSSGEYLLEGLPSGQYAVEMSPSIGSMQDYLTQYYDTGTSPEEAKAVIVENGEITPGINGQLDQGGRISGTVTDSSTGLDVKGALVCAFAVSKEEAVCTITGSNGEYVSPPLPSGAYKLEFADPRVYLTEYYIDASSYSEAQSVSITEAHTTGGVSVAMHSLKSIPPINTTLPLISGNVSVGGTLRCAAGLWTGGSATFAYQWLRDGTPIPNATGSSYEIQSADEGHGLSCDVTAKSSGGEGSARSVSVLVPDALVSPQNPTLVLPETGPTGTGAIARVTVVGSRLVVLGSSVSVQLRCQGTACEGTIELTMQSVARHTKGGKATPHKASVLIARGLFALAGGKGMTIALNPTAAGRKLLAQAKGHPKSAELSLSTQGGNAITKRVTVR